MKILISSFVVLVISCVLVVGAESDYEDKLTKLWSLSSSSRSDGARTAVVNVTSASILIQPGYDAYGASEKSDRQPKMSAQYRPLEYKRYAFKPRAIPLKRDAEHVDRSVHYENSNQYKSDILLPGNYFPIADVKRKNLSEETTFNPLAGGAFHPKLIPLLRSQEFQRRSLDVDEEPTIEKPNGFVEAAAQRRSWPASLFDEDEDDDDEADEDEDVELEEEDDEALTAGKGHHKKKKKQKIIKQKRIIKYMLPLLLAYKLKFFSLIPVMIGGLVLLVGATGLAGFFFALFAAVMGLQKGSY